tara:strand:+ start:1175 stop:1459 length:285 start_codon:yes stop_codon:yes gene_type:complete
MPHIPSSKKSIVFMLERVSTHFLSNLTGEIEGALDDIDKERLIELSKNCNTFKRMTNWLFENDVDWLYHNIMILPNSEHERVLLAVKNSATMSI